MPKCCVSGCDSRYDKNKPQLSFHKIPQNQNRRQKWIQNIGEENLNLLAKSNFVCSLHFEESCFNRTLQQIRLRDDATPSIFPNQRTSGSLPQSTVLMDQINKQIGSVYIPTCDNLQQSVITKRTNENMGSVEQPTFDNSRQSVIKRTIENVGSVEQSRKIHELTRKCMTQRIKIKRLQDKCRRQEKKIANFQNIIAELQSKNIISGDTSIILEECAGPQDFLKRQVLKSKGLPLSRSYSEEMRKFALTLNFLSPRAYNYVRRTYNTCLPHPRTLSNWYKTINAEPGFTKEAFDTLKLKAQLTKRPILCSLVIDEMSIRKSLNWDSNLKKFLGRVSMGGDSSDSQEMASQSLVFMLTAINDSWKLPVGYFFINQLVIGVQKANLVQVCIKMAEEVGVSVVSLTCDGPSANLSMLQLLGCKDILENQNITMFRCSQSNIHIFLDPCHAIKLVRNTLGELKMLIDGQGREINFKYIENLLKVQENNKLHLATKITKAHVDFFKQKMKVRLATQVLSNSVADAIEFCNNELKYPEFQGSEGTVNFIRYLNDIFDVLNSHSVRPPGWRKAMCNQNIGLVTALFESASDYIKTLKLSTGQLVIKSRRKTGFIGLLICMNSALNLFKELVTEKKKLYYLPLYKFSQDHLEIFFSHIRSRGGFNNNPNAVQFRAAYKRLLIRAEIRDQGVGNCIPLEQINILTCSNKVPPITNINNLTERHSFVDIPEDDSDLYEEYLDYTTLNLSEFANHVVTYIGGFVARKLCKTLKCEVCISLLLGKKESYAHSLITQKNRGGLQYPSKDVVEILKQCEKIVRNELEKCMSKNYYLYIFHFLCENCSSIDKVFHVDNEHDTDHKFLLIKGVIRAYLNLRFKYHGKKICEKVSLRNHLTKAILFRNE